MYDSSCGKMAIGMELEHVDIPCRHLVACYTSLELMLIMDMHEVVTLLKYFTFQGKSNDHIKTFQQALK